ncbi:hypothetical protein Mgra_00003864 [Meloidogyne graminicola]|uniref:Uncharacterized protein n=1 Tax=Meloidogyne graminicola TaxID=189291 RepID=A0A8S9ZTS0_9BILA|nr:hypothetical protein Mgra_00003864 [Meloidogyne graminicola]
MKMMKKLLYWQYSINKKIPLFSFLDQGEYSEGCIVTLTSLNKKRLKLTLPNYRKNIKEMKIVRFWLEQLFRCAFRKNFGVIFNPEMIKILFQNNKNIPLKFNIQVYNTRFHASYHKNEIEYMRDHLFISKEIYLRFHFMSNIEKQKWTFLDLNLLLLHSQWASIVWTDDVDDFLNLYNLIINFIEMSKFCSEVELYIIFSGLSYLKWKIEAANIVHLENHACACLYENILNPKIKFFNVFVYENPNDDIIDHIIIRKMQPGWPYN